MWCFRKNHRIQYTFCTCRYQPIICWQHLLCQLLHHWHYQNSLILNWTSQQHRLKITLRLKNRELFIKFGIFECSKFDSVIAVFYTDQSTFIEIASNTDSVMEPIIYLLKFPITYILIEVVYTVISRSRRGRDRMVVGFTTTCAISAYYH